MSGPGHWGANWGWIACRTAVMNEAVRLFVNGEDDAAQLLRRVAGNTLVLRKDTLKDSPVEHCPPNCKMHGGVYQDGV